jgi:hypothetical protein
MCNTVQAGSPLSAPPRWGRLYAVAATPLAILAVAEAAAPSGPLRTLLRYAAGLAVIAGMALWVRRNRVALDLSDWCACAGAEVTIRVIESDPRWSPVAPDPVVLSPDESGRERELVHR